MIRWTATVILFAVLLSLGQALGEEMILRDGQWESVAAPEPGTPQSKIAEIEQALREGKERKAYRLAKLFVKDNPGHPDVERALYLAGQAQMERGRYWSAFEWFEEQVSTYPLGRLFERGLVRQAGIAEAFLAGRKRWLAGILPVSAKDEGLEILQRVAQRLPGSLLADRCLMTVADYYFQRKRWDDAIAAYDQYVDMFGDRLRSSEAELQACNAAFNSFRGVEWDDTPLLEARQRYSRYLSSHPRSDEAAMVSGRLDTIEQTRARKDFEVARFYQRIGRPGAAAIYYREIMRLYPGTNWADLSTEALERLGRPAGQSAGPMPLEPEVPAEVQRPRSSEPGRDPDFSPVPME